MRLTHPAPRKQRRGAPLPGGDSAPSSPPGRGGCDRGLSAGATPLLRLKYHDSIADAVADLGGKPEEINQAFAGFQKYLYASTP